MLPHELMPDVHWVGAVDWSGRDFHGYSLSPMGTTYNAYLVKDEKITLFDTVKAEFQGEMLCRIANVVEPERIDYFVINHVEPDHAGCLPRLIERCKPEKIFCSPMGERAMQAHFHYKDWPVQVVKTGDSISLGKRQVRFMETRMLHWPDSMFSYIPQDKLLISNDAFGQNIAGSERFADELPRPVLAHAMKEYYANIVLPFSQIVDKVLDQVASLGLEIEMIAPDHGLIFRGADCAYALESYRAFAAQKPLNKAVIFYDTMWHSTEKMARAIAEGLEQEGVSVRLLCLKTDHHSRVMTEVMDAAAVIVGSPTHNNGILPNVAKMLTYMKGLKPQNKLGAAFGSFGWSGESVKVIGDWLESMHVELVDAPVKVKHVPNHEDLGACFELGRKVGQAVQAKVQA
jgi:flavorubredoxin